MVKVHNLIIHQIHKVENETNSTTIELSEDAIPIDSQAESMVEELERRYSLLNHTTAVFDKNEADERKQLPRMYRNLIDENQPESNFTAFSREATKNLVSYINSVPPAKGGYLIFVEYENRDRFVAVFLVRNKKGSTFQMDPKAKRYKITDTIYIDLEHLAMAARINQKYFLTANRYITFINKAQHDSKYFLNWFCADDTQNNIEDTKTFRKILSQINTPENEDGQPTDQQSFIEEVYKHIKNLPRGSFINLKSIGLAFYNDENRLTTFADEKGLVINTEFKADGKELKKLVNLNAKADRISINFPSDYFEQRKIIIQEDLIIIKSEALVKKILLEQRENE